MLYLLGIIVLCFGEQIPAILLACDSFKHLPARNNEIIKKVPSQEVHSLLESVCVRVSEQYTTSTIITISTLVVVVVVLHLHFLKDSKRKE